MKTAFEKIFVINSTTTWKKVKKHTHTLKPSLRSNNKKKQSEATGKTNGIYGKNFTWVYKKSVRM